MSERTPAHLVLGAGLTGLSLARRLREATGAPVFLVERGMEVGGLAGGRVEEGRILDPGSHRIHPGSDPEALAEWRSLPGVELLRRPRRGRIRVGGRWLAYPPSSLELLGAFGWRTGVRFVADGLAARVRGLMVPGAPANFRSYAVSRVGRSLYERFYRPYARRLFAHDPRDLDAAPAAGRLRALSARRVLAGLATCGSGSHYLYPRGGFGRLAGAMRDAFIAAGGTLLTGSEALGFRRGPDGALVAVFLRTPEGMREIPVRSVTATVPPPALAAALGAGEGAAAAFAWRSLRLVHLDAGRVDTGGAETLYFPEPESIAGRVSRIDLYDPGLAGPDGRATLCLEIPCTPGDGLARRDPARLAAALRRDLARFGIVPDPAAVCPEPLADRTLDAVYPLQTIGWRRRLAGWLDAVAAVPNLGAAGRTGLYLHCNADHCLRMARERANGLLAGESAAGWRDRLAGFLDCRIRE